MVWTVCFNVPNMPLSQFNALCCREIYDWHNKQKTLKRMLNSHIPIIIANIVLALIGWSLLQNTKYQTVTHKNLPGKLHWDMITKIVWSWHFKGYNYIYYNFLWPQFRTMDDKCDLTCSNEESEGLDPRIQVTYFHWGFYKKRKS